MKSNIGSWLAIIGIFLFFLWQGIPAYNKWQADNLVDELCAKDGGIKVYEAVTLPKERFNQWGQFQILDKRVMNSNDDFYWIQKVENIKGNLNSTDIGEMTIARVHHVLYRSSDTKIMGESISYGRRGGDSFGPWHPSSYICPRNIDTELVKQIFHKSTN